MNEIFFIIRDDFRQIRSSIMVRISIVLLITVPLFFTWFNVLATWNPFANSGRLQIAVASTDEGYTSKILNVKVNVGDTVLKELAVNDQFDWVLTSEDKALEGARSGDYYAAIVLPKDFSHSMFTFYAGGAAPANITLYTNEKKNPLSANLTNQGAQGVTAKINTTFSQTLAEVTVGIAGSVEQPPRNPFCTVKFGGEHIQFFVYLDRFGSAASYRSQTTGCRGTRLFRGGNRVHPRFRGQKCPGQRQSLRGHLL